MGALAFFPSFFSISSSFLWFPFVVVVFSFFFLFSFFFFFATPSAGPVCAGRLSLREGDPSDTPHPKGEDTGVHTARMHAPYRDVYEEEEEKVEEEEEDAEEGVGYGRSAWRERNKG